MDTSPPETRRPDARAPRGLPIQATVETLAELGYTVLEVNGAAAALEHIAKHPEIRLLFTDIVMPDVNGPRLAEEALKLRPGVKVLFTTGFTRNAVVHKRHPGHRRQLHSQAFPHGGSRGEDPPSAVRSGLSAAAPAGHF